MMRSADAGRPGLLPRVALEGVTAPAFAVHGTRQWLDAGAVAGIPDRGHARPDDVYRGAAGEGAQGG